MQFSPHNAILKEKLQGSIHLEGLLQWLRQLELGGLLELILIVASSLLCITVHETCHGLLALLMGDDTARRQGRLSLNPLRHVDLMGLIMMAVARFGWAKAVPVEMKKFRHPRTGMALTALAGPVSNILLALLALILRSPVLKLFLQYNWPVLEYIWLFLEYTILLSAGLAVFNLFPIPPLDGSKVMFALLPAAWYHQILRYERWGMVLLAALLFFGVLDAPLTFLRNGLLEGLSAISYALMR